MAENLRKIGLYFRDINAYWQLTQADVVLATDTKSLGRYPLDITKRIITAHYDRFDGSGLPTGQSSYGRGSAHNYTTLCSFALGHWNFYLQTGHKSHLSKVTDVSEYMIRTAHTLSNGAVLLRCESEGGEHSGLLSAMNQGEAMSVLCRAWQATGNSRYLEAALGCLEPFEIPVEAGGVLGNISMINCPWYEEDPALPLRHILNGMIYSLWGLSDLAVAAKNKRAQELFDTGVESLIRALPYFENGYWSMYWVPEDDINYVASIMYHNLHICQLIELHRQTGRAEFRKFAMLFTGYARRPLCRMRAAASISCSKFLNLIKIR
jgi:heparosan-N-sulfate-glucuronate 5-epimerase